MTTESYTGYAAILGNSAGQALYTPAEIPKFRPAGQDRQSISRDRQNISRDGQNTDTDNRNACPNNKNACRNKQTACPDNKIACPDNKNAGPSNRNAGRDRQSTVTNNRNADPKADLSDRSRTEQNITDLFKNVSRLSGRITDASERLNRVRYDRERSGFTGQTDKFYTEELALSSGLDMLMGEFMTARSTAYAYIDLLEDMRDRLVLEYRYIDDLKWREISERLSVTKRCLLKRHRKAIACIALKLDGRNGS